MRISDRSPTTAAISPGAVPERRPVNAFLGKEGYMGQMRADRLWIAALMLGLVGIPLFEAWAASTKSPQSSDTPGASTGHGPTAEEKALLMKGQLLFDRMCPLMLRDLHNTLQRAQDFIAGRKPATDPDSLRYQDQVHREAEVARRDLELFEIDVKVRYGGRLPSWWQYKATSEECRAVAKQLKIDQQK
jgi:hypothetical protein